MAADSATALNKYSSNYPLKCCFSGAIIHPDKAVTISKPPLHVRTVFTEMDAVNMPAKSIPSVPAKNLIAGKAAKTCPANWLGVSS